MKAEQKDALSYLKLRQNLYQKSHAFVQSMVAFSFDTSFILIEYIERLLFCHKQKNKPNLAFQIEIL